MTNVVAIHGNGGGAHRFALAAPHFPASVRFIPLTLPGFADRPADPSLPTLDDYAWWICHELAALPPPRIVLGHGIGGSLALQLAQHAGAPLDGLILHAPVGAALDQRLFPKLMALPGARRAGQLAFASPILRPLWRRLLFRQPVADAYLDRFFEEYGQCQRFGQMFDLIDARWFGSLQPMNLPSALLWGGRERVLSADQAQAFQRLLPAAGLHIVDHWDHFPMIDHPQEYARVITALATECLHA